MTISAIRRALALVAIALLSCTPALAEAPASTLDRIAETGTIRIGYGDTPPFSFKDANGTVTGYSIELCERVAEGLRRRLGLERIAIEYVPRTASNRIQLLDGGDLDIECNASTRTPERERAAIFAPPHFYTTTRFVSLALNGFSRLEDLKGRSVSVTRGTVNAMLIARLGREHELNLGIVPADTVREAFDLVAEGRVAAFAMDDVLLKGMIAQSEHPDVFAVSKEALDEPRPYGFMTRINDRPFAEAVSEILVGIYASPGMPALYDRWFNRAFAERQRAIEMPMSDLLSASMRPAN